MALHAFFLSIQHSLVGKTIGEGTWMFPTLESLHVVFLTIVVGTVAIVDLRLLGVASKDQKVSDISHQLLPWTWGAFALAAVTGGLLFSSRAADYMALSQFTGKFVVMGLAGLNMLAFHFMTYRTVGAWDLGPTPAGAKLAGGLSLVFWAAIVLLGRQVGFHL